MSICSKKFEHWGRVDPQIPHLSDWTPATYEPSGAAENQPGQEDAPLSVSAARCLARFHHSYSNHINRGLQDIGVVATTTGRLVADDEIGGSVVKEMML